MVTPRLLPPDVLKGYARRLDQTKVPVNKLPEIYELRAIGRELLSHIAALTSSTGHVNKTPGAAYDLDQTRRQSAPKPEA